MEHEACRTLPYAAFKVLAVIAVGYNGRNNGTLACTESWGRRFGITGTDTVRRSLRELVNRGLIEITRRGLRIRNVPTLYALAWEPIDYRDGSLLDRAVPATWRYRQWAERHRSTAGVVAVNTANSHPLDGVESPLRRGPRAHD